MKLFWVWLIILYIFFLFWPFGLSPFHPFLTLFEGRTNESLKASFFPKGPSFLMDDFRNISFALELTTELLMRSWWWRKWFFTFNASLLCWEDKIRRTFLMNCYVCGQSGARHWDFFFFFQPNQNCHLIWHKDRLQRTYRVEN